MSQGEHTIAISYEIERLNQIIDKKIIKGVNYCAEAKKHRELLRLLKRDKSQFSLSKVFSFIGIF